MQMNRRRFLQLGACAGLTTCLSQFEDFFTTRAEAEEARQALKIVKYSVKVGAEKPFTALHISDTHLTFADERETERKQKLAESRLRYFGKAEKNLAAAADYAKEKNAILLHTGDMIEYVSEKNFEYAADFYGQPDQAAHFVSSGNHQ